MFSIPMITPRPNASLWPSHCNTYTDVDEPRSNSPPNANGNTNFQRRPTSRHDPHNNHARAATALLAALENDENMLEQRKQNVRRFGAGWLRPPGVAKTLQAMKDEELEKEEQEMMHRREQAMMDISAAQQEVANEEQREQGEQMNGQGEEEYDLDDEVPEAHTSDSEMSRRAGSDSDESEEEVGSDDEQNTTVPFNEDSFIEGSMVEAEVSHMLEMEEAEMEGVLQDERDLDDDVPEAGSYEHTDSELEDSSDVDNSMVLPSTMNSLQSRRSTMRLSGMRSSGGRSSELPSEFVTDSVDSVAGAVSLGVNLGQGRSSFGIDGSSSFLDGSSFMRSSPVGTAAATRGTLRDRFLGAARGGRRA